MSVISNVSIDAHRETHRIRDFNCTNAFYGIAGPQEIKVTIEFIFGRGELKKFLETFLLVCNLNETEMPDNLLELLNALKEKDI